MFVEKNDPFKDPIRILKAFGFWMSRSSNPAYSVYGIIMHLFLVDLFLLLQFMYLFTYETIEDFAALMTVLPTYVAIFSQTLNVMLKPSRLVELLKRTEDLLKQCADSDTTRLNRSLVIIDKISKGIFFLAFVAGVVSTISTAFKLPYKMWFPYDPNSSRFYLPIGFPRFIRLLTRVVLHKSPWP